MLRELTKQEYLETFAPPMRRLQPGDVMDPVPIGAYVDELLPTLNPPLAKDAVEIPHVYEGPDGRFNHVLLYFSIAECYLAIIVDKHEREVRGHYLLDLVCEYGLDEPGVADA